jgi:hypothetical protein
MTGALLFVLFMGLVTAVAEGRVMGTVARGRALTISRRVFLAATNYFYKKNIDFEIQKHSDGLLAIVYHLW